MIIVAADMEGSIGPRPMASETSVDEVQDLIGRTEEILDTLKQLGDTSYDRLRLKFNENVNVVRDKLIDRAEVPENGGDAGRHPLMRSSVARLSVATLAGFVIGFVVARLCGASTTAPKPDRPWRAQLRS